MEVLRELVRIITKVKLRSIRKLGFPLETDNRLADLYKLIEAGTADGEIAPALTGKKAKSGTFRRLKADLTDRLIGSLFLVDLSLPSYNNRQRAYFEVHKNWAAVKILLGKNARKAAIDLSTQTLRQALRYEFNDIAYDIVRNLRLHYGTVAPGYQKYQEYDELFRRLQQIVQAETLAEDIYTRFIIEYVRKKAGREELIKEVRRSHQSLAPYTARFDSYSLHLYTGLLEMGIHTASSEYATADEDCDQVITFFEAKPYVASVPLQIAYYQKLLCHFQLQRFTEVETFVSRGLELLQEGAYNWFKFQVTYLILALHTKQYEVAFQVFKRVTGHSRFRSQNAEITEYWRVLEAYLHFLLEIGELPAAQDDAQFTKFRLGRFLNQTPLFSRDKRGVNVSILIIQILLLVARGRYGNTYDKIDAMEQYARRHLFTQDTLRSYYFVKALLELPKNSFHREAVQRKAAKHLKRLESFPLETATQRTFITEILPFEQQWHYAIQFLSNRFYK